MLHSVTNRVLFLFLLVSSFQVAQAGRPDWCQKLLASLAGETKEDVQPQLETVDDMLWAFSNGLVLDPKNPAQLQAFEVYLKMRFGSPGNAGDIKAVIERISKELKKHPELAKVPLRNHQMSMAERSYPVTEALLGLMKTPVEAAGQSRGNLFQIEANLGFWRKLLRQEEPKAPAELTKDQKKEWSKKERERFIAYLDQVIPAELRAALTDTKAPISTDEKAKQLFQHLSVQRKKMLAAGEDVVAISRAMVDLVHTIGFHKKEIQTDLKSEDGLKRIAALRRAMDERDQFAMAVGYAGHFEEMLKDLGVKSPSGLESNEGFLRRIGEVEHDVMSKAMVKTSTGSQKEIRQLSLMEAPFRSCIGGSDCSSRTYLTRALDPNYQYFTITDADGHSNGQLTVVLGALPGKAKSRIPFLGGGGEEKKIAFIDKIQNVPHEDLPIMIEAVRRSLAEKGYTLVLPEDLGDHNGISNASETREFVKRWVNTTGETLTGYKPHPHGYSLDSQYSRADKGLAVKAVAALELPDHVRLTPTEEGYAWKTKELDLDKLVAGSRRLKDGDTDDRIRYIEAQKTIKAAGLAKDPVFESTIEGWLQDSSLPFQLRKRVLLYKWLEENGDLPTLLSPLKPSERVDFVQNSLDTPRLKDAILKKKNQIPALLVQVRTNKKLVANLADQFSRGHTPTIGRVLEAEDISDERALAVLKQIKTSFSTQNMTEATEILRAVAGTSIEAEVKSGLIQAYVANVSNPARLAREVVRHLSHPDATTARFAREVLDTQSSSASPIPMMVAVREIEALSQGKSLSHREAAEEWLSDPKNDVVLKSEYMRAHLTAEDFERLQAKLPSKQQRQVTDALAAKSNAGLFRKLAEKSGIPKDALSKTTSESFEFEAFKFPKEGKKVTLGSPQAEPGRYGDEENQRDVTFTKPFAMQATAVTNFQYRLYLEATGKNLEKLGAIKSKDPNEPVVEVNYTDALEYAKWLSDMDPHNKYDLPTDAQREYAARGGTTTRYWSGDSEGDLARVSWYSGNSGNRVHAVAELQPNPYGLYDVHGNVWEWCKDWYTSDTTKLSGVDPQGPSSGSVRVVRGGSWDNSARSARSARRYGSVPGNR